jgi:hypothetical protein
MAEATSSLSRPVVRDDVTNCICPRVPHLWQSHVLAPEARASSLSDLLVRNPRNSEGSLLPCSGRTGLVVHRFEAGVHFENYTDPRKMSVGNATRVVQKLITSYFSAAPTVPSVAELSSDSEIGLYKGG